MAGAEAPCPDRCARCARLEQDNARLSQQVSALTQALEESRRAGKRQAAPFSKGPPKTDPKRPGRRCGAQHGRHGHRAEPDHIDEVIEVPLPPRCPHCAGHIQEDEVAAQFHTELPPVCPRVTRFEVHVGHCQDCGLRVQGRHPRQHSTALGAAASQVGPRALALGAYLHKALGLPLAKCTRLFAEHFGIALTRGGLCQAVARVADAAAPTYGALQEWLREEPVVSPDETGWKVQGQLQWLWVFVSPTLTVYSIQPGRGFEQAAAILGEDYSGTLVRDGWAPYRQFTQATHQTCLAHILRRVERLLETAQRGAARLPRALQRLIDQAFGLRRQRDTDQITDHGLKSRLGMLNADLSRLLGWQPSDPDNARLIKHLTNEHQHEALFTFLLDPAVPATNYRAEQAIRPAVVTRKVCGGNRSANGAHTQEILASVFQTAHQQQRDSIYILTELMCAPEPRVAHILAPAFVAPARGPP